MANAASLLKGLWATLDASRLEGTPFEPRVDGRVPLAVRKHLFPTWLSLRSGSAIDRDSRAKLVRASGHLTDEGAAATEAWFESVRARIESDCEWYRILRSQYDAHRSRSDASDEGAAVPAVRDIAGTLMGLVKRLGASPVNPLADADVALHTADQALRKLASPVAMVARSASIRAEARRGRDRYERLIHEAWEAAPLNRPPVDSPRVTALLDTVAAGATHTIRGSRNAAIQEGDAGSRARVAWEQMVSLDDEVAAYRSPHLLGLSAVDKVEQPQLLDSRSSVSASDLPRLQQPLVPRITRLLRPDPLWTSADLALERAIASSAQPYGLADPRSRATLVLAYRARAGIEPAYPDAYLDSAQMAVRFALRKSGAVSLALEEESRAERVMSYLTDQHRPVHGLWLQRVWGNLWRRELNGQRVDDLDEAWDLIVGVAYSFGQALRPKVTRLGEPGTDGHEGQWTDDDALDFGSTEQLNAMIAVFQDWDDEESQARFVSRVRKYKPEEVAAILDDLPEPLPATMSDDQAQWEEAVSRCARQSVDEEGIAELATWKRMVRSVTWAGKRTGS